VLVPADIGAATSVDLTAHTSAAAPHSGHETPAGAQAKVDAHANRTDNPHGVTAEQVNALPLGGGTLTGALTLAADPTNPLEAATRQFVLASVGSGGGQAALLVKDITVGADTNLVCLGDDLDIVRDGGYILKAAIVENSGAAGNGAVYLNGDLANANYRHTGMYVRADGAVMGTGNTQDSTLFNIDATVGAVTRITSEIDLAPTGIPFIMVEQKSQGGYVSMHGSHRIITSTNVTRIDVSSTVAKGIGAGSHFQLFRRLPGIIPDVTPQESRMLVYETTLAQAATQIDIPGLDGNADGGYEVKVDWVNPTASAVSLKLFANGDMADADYNMVYISGSGSGTTSGGGSKPEIATAVAGGWGEIQASVWTNSLGRLVIDATGKDSRSYMVLYGNTSVGTGFDNINSLTLQASVTNALGIGTRIRVYRKNVPVYLVQPSNTAEYGSNANGEYEKHPNGVLECWGEGTIPSGSQSNARVFPCSFLSGEIPVVTVTSGYSGNASGLSAVSRTATGFTCYYTASGAPGSSIPYGWRAIGRWK
jgi:hypothetical protein